MTQPQRTVLVVGTHGIIGRHVAEHFAGRADTRVIGLARRDATLPGVEPLAADLLRPDDLRAKLAKIAGLVTHVVFAAYVERPTARERSAVNSALLVNLLDAVDDFPRVEHVTFYQGGKAYGSDLGPYKTPAREDDPRLMPPNFYYEQEDLVRARRQRGTRWSFTGLRPDGVSGFATGNPMNLTMGIAVYAAISRELGLPLRFPGTEVAYRAMMQLTSADVLAEATIWAGETPAARDEIFNITNGDTFRWQHVWPRIARMLGMEVADPVPFSLTEYMADKAPLWDEMVRKYDLSPIPYDQVVSWPFCDAVFRLGYDNVFSTVKARQAGFHECVDSEEMFSRFFAKIRAMRVIPA